MIRALPVILALLAPVSAAAEEATLLPAGDLAGVGLLSFADGGSCTGALIAPDLVLTAGHCLIGEGTDAASDVTFWPGRRPGAPRPDPIAGQAKAVHPLYGLKVGTKGMRLGFDIGLLRLAAPVQTDVATPLPLGPLPNPDAAVLVAGYPEGRGTLARQRPCPIGETNHAFSVLLCAVVAGESGSPMFGFFEGTPQIVGVVASRGRVDGAQVGYGPVIKTQIETLKTHLLNVEALSQP